MANDNNKKSSKLCLKNSVTLITDFLKKISSLFVKFTSHVHFLEPKNNTLQRIISAIFLIPVALFAMFGPEEFFMFVVICLTIIMSWEWLHITRLGLNIPENKKKWQLIGFFYILIPVFSVVQIYFYNVDILFWMFAIIWATDIFAFFAGRTFGGPKLAPTISPNKTWSGLAGGVLASVFIGFLSSFMFKGDIMFFMIISVLLSVLEQLSDLFESKVKRTFNVKDSGTIIPGHGGVLDRLDGLMFTAPAVLILITIFPGKF